MKRILSLALVIILAMSSLLLVACDDKTNDPASTTVVTTAAATTAEPEEEGGSGGGASKPADDPVKVDKLNGKTARELYVSAYEAYASAETYDVDFRFDIEGESEKFIFKRGESGMYMNINFDGDSGEYWDVDGVLYGQDEGEKLKITGGSLEALFGANMIRELLFTPFLYADESKLLSALDSAQLCSQGDEYYFQITLTGEANIHGYDSESYSETVYFDAQGNIKRVVCESNNDYKVVATINSYGKPVAVSAPADADSFVEYGGSSPEGDRTEIADVAGRGAAENYAKFLDEFFAASSYDVVINARYYGNYSKRVEYIILRGEDSFYSYQSNDGEAVEYWVVDNVMYGKGYGDCLKMAVDSFEGCYVVAGMNELLRELFLTISKDESVAALADTKLYYSNGERFFERSLTEAEAENLGFATETAKETVYLNEQGIVTKKVISAAEATITIEINSYGVPVSVDAPANADSFVDVNAAD